VGVYPHLFILNLEVLGMKKLRIVFYKGTPKGFFRLIISKLIKVLSKSKYSHVGIVIGDFLYDIDFWHPFSRKKFDWISTDYDELVFMIPKQIMTYVKGYLMSKIWTKYSMRENVRYLLKRINLSQYLPDNPAEPNCVESVHDLFISIENEYHYFKFDVDNIFMDTLSILSVEKLWSILEPLTPYKIIG